MDATGYGDFRARREATIWQRMNHVLRVLLFVAAWLLIISFFLPPYKKLNKNRAEMEQIQAQLTEAKTFLARQTRQVSLLKSDPTYLETIARDKLDLMKEGETIFRLESRRGTPPLPAKP
ncbi:MAG: septum formation initiator family protein [Spartobacteria bacterium]